MAFTMNIQAQLPAAATRARHSASRRASAVVRAEGEASSPAAATVYFTNKAGQRVTATDEEVRRHITGGRCCCRASQGVCAQLPAGAQLHTQGRGHWCPPCPGATLHPPHAACRVT